MVSKFGISKLPGGPYFQVLLLLVSQEGNSPHDIQVATRTRPGPTPPDGVSTMDATMVEGSALWWMQRRWVFRRAGNKNRDGVYCKFKFTIREIFIKWP